MQVRARGDRASAGFALVPAGLAAESRAATPDPEILAFEPEDRINRYAANGHLANRFGQLIWLID